MGHHIIMGRKTYESLGRLLPGRTTVIVTRNPNYHVEGAFVAQSLDDALTLCKGDDEPFLIGGAQMYAAGLDLANKLYITHVNVSVEGDAFFPNVVMGDWHLLEKEDKVSENGLEYSDVVYEKKA